MKKILIMLLSIVFTLSILFLGISCKEEVAPAEEAVEEVAEEAVEEVAEEAVEEDMSKPPYKVEFSWGNFELGSRIISKLDNKEPINFVLSFQTIAAVDAANQYMKGMEGAAEGLGQKYGIEIIPRVIGPVETDPPAQIAEIESLIQAGQIDVLSIQPPNQHGFEDIIAAALAEGIPTYTIGSDSPDANRIAYYGPNDTPTGNGTQVADHVIQWSQDNNFELEAVAMVSGDTTAEWSQGRMAGFYNTITEALPDVTIYGTPTDAAVSTGWNSADMYSKVEAFMIGHPDVNFLFSSDWTGVPISQVIIDLGLEGQVYCMGYNVDEKIIEFVSKGLVGDSPLISSADQYMAGQGSYWLTGAAEFLFEGIVPDDVFQYVPIRVISLENIDDVKDDFGLTK